MSFRMPAVQEERQRSRERAESEVECAISGHEDMPVERILEAELAVEPKTESYGDMNMDNSVFDLRSPSTPHFLDGLRVGMGGESESQNLPLTLPCFFFRQTTLSPIYAMRPISSFSLLLNGPSASPTSLTSPWRTRSFCSGQVRVSEFPSSWHNHAGCHLDVLLGPSTGNLMGPSATQAVNHFGDRITLSNSLFFLIFVGS